MWMQASGNNMVDLYNATLDDYCRAAMQSTAYYNFLNGRGGGFGPDRMVLKLRSATRSGDLKKIAQAVGELTADTGLNSRIPHLEGESIFGSAKTKLDLPPGVGTRILIFSALDPKTLPKSRNSEVCNSKTRKTG
jgi:hypothetical protein